jgi:ATP/ADP translocase
MVGGLLVKVIAPNWGTETLLPICVPLMAATIVLLYRLTPARTSETPKDSLQPPELQNPGSTQQSKSSVIGAIWHSRYLSMLMVVLVTGVIVEAFIDFEFKFIAKSAFDSKDKLTAFLGTMAIYGGVLALLVQTTPDVSVSEKIRCRLHDHGSSHGVSRFVCPVSSSGPPCGRRILKVIDGGLSHSIHRSGMELLYVPISEKQRAAVKGVFDLVVDRAGRALGGILLLVSYSGIISVHYVVEYDCRSIPGRVDRHRFLRAW